MTPPWLSGFLRSLHQPQRAVGALAVALSLVLCALVAHDLQRDYEQQFAAAGARTSSLTHVLEEHTRQSMRRVELALSLAARVVESEHTRHGGVGPATGGRMRAYLPQDGLITSFSLIDASGRVVASTLGTVPPETPLVNDRDYFLAHMRPGQSGLFVGQASVGRMSGKWIIPVSVKLPGAQASYLMAAVNPEYFQRLYQSIDTGGGGFVTLFTVQAWAIARWPFASAIAQRNWADSPLFQVEIPKAPAAVVRQKLAASGVDSVYSYRVLPDFPLVVVLGVSLDDALKPWHRRVLYEGSGLLLVLLFLWGTTLVLVRQLRRRLAAEAALKLSEISLLKSSLPTLWIGSDARILRVNQAACDLHGYSEQEMLAMSITDLNPGMGAALWPDQWQGLRAARNLRLETAHRTRAGLDVPVEIELNFIEFEGREYNFAFVRDLRMRNKAEQDIQHSAALLRSAIDAVDEAFVLFDADDCMVYCNAKYTQLYPQMQDVLVPGVRFEDMIRIGAQRGLYRESVGRQEEWVAERMRAHREGNETRIQRRDDGRVLRVIDRRTPEGCIAGIRVDITEMVQATEEAQEASRYKSQFLANMSHEIRTPMNAILGLLALLQNTSLSAPQRDYVSKTEGAAQSLLRLLNDILDFSKVEAGKMELDVQPFPLDRMLRDLTVILSSTMAGKDIELLFDIDPSVPATVVADSMRLQQVLVNLGGNAVKFTTQGQVVLRVRNLSDAKDQQECQALLEFSIEDSGIGIAQQQQEHIFSGFSQAEASTTRRYGGTGLGLAISRRLVELMGGALVVHSVPGQGSTFSFCLRLPLVSGATPALPGKPVAALPPQRVLVVDDNPVACKILASMTRAWSWPTEVAHSGMQALEQVRRHGTAQDCGFDLIYLDWHMPDMDGWQTAGQIRHLLQSKSARPTIVLLSANGNDRLQQRSGQEQAWVDALLHKPLRASTVLDQLMHRSAASSGAQQPVHSTQRALAGLRILVVEDNLINQQVAQELLSLQGAMVSLAANGQLGVDAVLAAQPAFDLVLMDIQMPVLDGYGATRAIRQHVQWQNLPIIAMTANAMPSDRLACLAAGMNEHVGKPFDLDHLVRVVLQATGRMPHGEAVKKMLQLRPMYTSPYLDTAPALERISGLVPLYVEIAREFLHTLDAVDGEFRQKAHGPDASALVGLIHTLKGTSATLGANALSQRAAELEDLFRRAGIPSDPLQHLPALLTLVQHTRQSVEEAIAGMDSVDSSGPADGMEGDHMCQSGPAQRRSAQDFLTQLSDLLAHSNLGALDKFERRGQALAALSDKAVGDLQHALVCLDLDQARLLCKRHIAALA